MQRVCICFTIGLVLFELRTLLACRYFALIFPGFIMLLSTQTRTVFFLLRLSFPTLMGETALLSNVQACK